MYYNHNYSIIIIFSRLKPHCKNKHDYGFYHEDTSTNYKKSIEYALFPIVIDLIPHQESLKGFNPANYSMEIFLLDFNSISPDAIYSNIIFSGFMLLGAILLSKKIYSK